MTSCLVWFAVAALAATTPPAFTLPAPPTDDQIAASRAEGDRLLENAHAQSLFVNETGAAGSRATTLIRLRHRASGFLCTFDPGKKENRVAVYRSLTPGDDVGCTTRTITDVRTLFLVHAPEHTNADLLREAELAVHATFSSARAYTPRPSQPLFLLPPGLNLPEHVAASLMSDDGSDRIVLGKVGDWAVEYQFSGSPAVADMGSILDGFWTTTVLEARRRATETPAPGPAPATPPVPIADVKVEADALIARASASDLFENVTSGKSIEVRHRPSGFTCLFDSGQAENTITIYNNKVRGDDIGCWTREGDTVVSYFVTRPAQPIPNNTNLVDLLKIEVAAIRIAHPDATPATGPALQMTIQPKPGTRPPPPHVTARFLYQDHGAAAYSRVSVAVVRGWVVEQRVTAPIAKQIEADLIADLGITAAVDKMSREQAT